MTSVAATAAAPLKDPTVEPLDPESLDIAALLQWRQALQSTRSSQELYESIIKPNLDKINALHATQQFAHVFDQFLADQEVARERAGGSPFRLEDEFLQLQSHPSNSDFQGYLDNYAVQFWNSLMPNRLPDTLIHAVIGPALKSMVELVSTPWIIHLFVATFSTLPFVVEWREESSPSLASRLKLLKHPSSPQDKNPFVRDLLYRLGSRSAIFRMLKVLLWPLDDCVSILVNRIVLNTTKSDIPRDVLDGVDGHSNAIFSYIRDWLLVESHSDPTFKEQAEYRRMAIATYPKVFGAPVLASDTFDYRLANRRLVVSFMDEFLELLRV